MQEGKRQKQIAGLIQEEISIIFQRLGLNIIDGAMVSISSVKITPDLLESRIYLSIFNATDTKAVLKKIEERAWEVKKELASRVKHQLRRIPELKFFWMIRLIMFSRWKNCLSKSNPPMKERKVHSLPAGRQVQSLKFKVNFEVVF